MTKTKTIIGQQGEVRIIKLARKPRLSGCAPVTREARGVIVSHSESGHHHILTGGDVLERTKDVPAGMRILYAILKEPARLEQTAPGAHGAFDLAPGVYEFRISREYNPFADEARRVAD